MATNTGSSTAKGRLSGVGGLVKAVIVVGVALAVLISMTRLVRTVASPADEVAVHKGGGIIEAPNSKGCVAANSRELRRPGDKYFWYPASQRTYNFTGGEGADHSAFSVVSKDFQTLEVPGSVEFTLNVNCTVLTRFHDAIGNRYHAFYTTSDEWSETNDGWQRMLDLYFAPALDATLDRVAKKYTWKELYADPTIKDEMNRTVNEQLATLIQQKMPGEDEFFQGFSALIQQPTPSEALVQALADEEAGRAQAAAAKAKAVADAETTEARAVADAKAAEAAADAQVAQKEAEARIARLEAEIKAAQMKPFGSAKEYNNWLAIQNGLNPYQPTYGGSVVAPSPSTP
ncbi:SPFH domain-containing protein [Nostocoides vanveenii]|uniref:Band 7 domain-containing protein n=1 Tax=Nostocoides vanveenii TaxID=330835 RepID=A0ABP4XDZ5_9MICO